MTTTSQKWTEEDYAALGKALVEHAVSRVKASELTRNGTHHEATLEGYKIKLRFDAEQE